MPLPTILYWKPTSKSLGGKQRCAWTKAHNLYLNGRNRNAIAYFGSDKLKINMMILDYEEVLLCVYEWKKKSVTHTKF